MAINEQRRQLEVAREAEELLRTLAHSTRDVPNPRDSYSVLGELGAIIDHVAQVRSGSPRTTLAVPTRITLW